MPVRAEFRFRAKTIVTSMSRDLSSPRPKNEYKRFKDGRCTYKIILLILRSAIFLCRSSLWLLNWQFYRQFIICKLLFLFTVKKAFSTPLVEIQPFIFFLIVWWIFRHLKRALGKGAFGPRTPTGSWRLQSLCSGFAQIEGQIVSKLKSKDT